MELAFASEREFYRRRVEMVAAHTEPRRWLDVGGGHGHFCLSARATWPKATFDAIDLASSIGDAERRGWIDTGMRGFFPDLARGLAESYDVVSMHHYLEHTRDPGAELDAARTVLEPGGLLLVEMPDPDSVLARVLGQWWGAYLQPQHLHMPPLPLLERMLTGRGFTVIERHRAEAHQRGDLTGATYLAVNRLAPPVDVPWRAPSTPAQRVRRTAALTAAVPVLAAAAATDQLLGALLAERVTLSNAYRVLARRDG
jgi:SAM-dependent methyltransferase